MAMPAKAPMAPAPTLEEAWQICADLFSDLPAPALMPGSTDSEHELLFCLLGGFGVSYEHNRSAVEVIAPLDPFGSCRADGELSQLLFSTFSQALFGPPRGDGSLRRYRFP